MTNVHFAQNQRRELSVTNGDVLEMTQGNKPNEASGQWNRRKKEI